MSDVIDLIAQVEEALPANSTIRSDPLFTKLRAHRKIDHLNVVTSNLPPQLSNAGASPAPRSRRASERATRTRWNRASGTSTRRALSSGGPRPTSNRSERRADHTQSEPAPAVGCRPSRRGRRRRADAVDQAAQFVDLVRQCRDLAESICTIKPATASMSPPASAPASGAVAVAVSRSPHL
jgi:hypothetical protein